MVQGFCVKCKEKVDILKPKPSKTKRGVPMLKGHCPSCNTKVVRFGGVK